ncbi:MAG: VTT domain-containing protein [Ferruginibacter sp.]
MKKIIAVATALMFVVNCLSQDTVTFKNQYKADAKNIEVSANGIKIEPDGKGNYVLPSPAPENLVVSGNAYDSVFVKAAMADRDNVIFLKKNFTWTDLLTPMFYIVFGGLWFILFVVFAETGLFAGFFLPGDSLLFVAGIYSNELVQTGLGLSETGSLINLLILGVIISAAGILGNFVGYWFGRKSGPFLFERKDTFFFRKKYLFQAKEFFDKHGGGAIVMARFIPIIRTFAPIVAGIVGMEKKKFTYYNVVGCVAWVFTMLFAGHYLQQLFMRSFDFDLREHLEVIVIGIVLVSTLPVIIKLITAKTVKTPPVNNDQPLT